MEGITIVAARENVTKSPICGQKKLTVLFTHDLETFQFFAAVVLIAHLVGCHNTLTILGAHFLRGGVDGWFSAGSLTLLEHPYFGHSAFRDRPTFVACDQ
jgi:hypothetical protein